MDNKRDLLGKIFFAGAVLILLYMFISPISNVIINIDEYWTYTLVNLPFMDGMNVIIHDVHPPLHYLILYLLTPFGLENLYLLKVASIIPYILIMAVAGTKIRNEYGWLTAGLTVFCIGVMSDFFVEFLTIRMYSWGLFFLLMAFIYYGDVRKSWDRRSWMLLTLFTILAAYTQYFFIITGGLIYLALLYEILHENKDRLKAWAKSVAALIVLYIPWAPILAYQVMTQAEEAHESISLKSAIYYITSFAVKSETINFEMIALRIIAVAFLILILVVIYKKRDRYTGVGVMLIYATIAIGILLLMTSFCNVMRIRYLVPVLGIFWFSASIVIGRIEDRRVFIASVILILILSAASVAITFDDIDSRLAFNEKKDAFLESINTNDSVIVFNTDYGYRVLHDDLNRTKQYSLTDTYFYDNGTKVNKNLTDILDSNSGKDVYLVNWAKKDKNKKYEKNFNLDEKYDAGHYKIYLVTS